MVISVFKSVLDLSCGPSRCIVGAVCSALLIASFTVPCAGEPSSRKALPRVVMVSDARSIGDDDGLYMAIRAQLSATPVALARIEVAETPAAAPDTLKSAAELAAEHGAAMVFWIQMSDRCEMSFFVPDASGGRITTRGVDLDLSSQSSRYDVIAVVASSVIEGLLVSSSLKNAGPERMGELRPSLVINRGGIETKGIQFEMAAAYTGALVAADTFSHGITLGLGILAAKRWVVAASFTQNLKQQLTGESLRLDIISRQLEVLAAARVAMRPLDVRLGICWSMDFRSLVTTAKVDSINPRQNDLVVVHSLVPMLSVAWLYRDRIGLFGRVGASLGLNEAVYKIKIHPEGEIDAFSPFVAELNFQFGLMIHI